MKCRLIVVILYFISQNSIGGIIPDADTLVLSQQLAELYEHTKSLHSSIDEARKIKNETEKTVMGITAQIDELKATKKLLGEGHFQLGNKFDSVNLKKWRNANQYFDDFLNAYKGNSGALGAIGKRLSKDFGLQSSGSIYTKSASRAQMNLYDEIAKTAIAAGAQSEYAYGGIKDINQMLDALQAEIDKTDNQKALLELIARVQIENARINAMRVKNDSASLKVNSLNMQQTATDAQWVSDFLRWEK